MIPIKDSLQTPCPHAEWISVIIYAQTDSLSGHVLTVSIFLAQNQEYFYFICTLVSTCETLLWKFSERSPKLGQMTSSRPDNRMWVKRIFVST